jgi:hypothetical protein
MCVNANRRLINLRVSLKDTVCVKELGHIFRVADLPSLRDLWIDVTSTSKGVYRLFTRAVRNRDTLGPMIIPSTLISRLDTLVLDFSGSPRLSAHVWGLTRFLHVLGAPPPIEVSESSQKEHTIIMGTSRRRRKLTMTTSVIGQTHYLGSRSLYSGR